MNELMDKIMNFMVFSGCLLLFGIFAIPSGYAAGWNLGIYFESSEPFLFAIGGVFLGLTATVASSMIVVNLLKFIVIGLIILLFIWAFISLDLDREAFPNIINNTNSPENIDDLKKDTNSFKSEVKE